MSRIKIITDSTADLPKEIINKYDIEVVPLKVHMGEEVLKDGIEISPGEFYSKLKALNGLPTTSQPSPGEFKEVYEKYAQEGYSIISVHISSQLSGTYQSAMMAKDLVPAADITVIDSRSVTMGLGLMVMNLAKAAQEGVPKEEILELADGLKQKIHIYFIVDTLEYLQKGGRIGKAQAFLGSLLNIKPILTVKDGIVAPIEKIRGQKKALEKLVQLTAEFTNPKTQIALLQGDNEEGLLKLKEKIMGLPVDFLLRAEVGPVVGTHVGPGVLGIVILDI